MYGAILGDIIGSPYEFDYFPNTKEFPLLVRTSRFTDDSVMTVAVAEAFLNARGERDDDLIRSHVIRQLRLWARRYPYAGYGGKFIRWSRSEDPRPYNSWGNGSAMRVSAVAWLFDDLDTVRRMARLSADVTHNHPEGIKGAEATAAAIFLARTGSTKAEIKTYMEEHFAYDLSRTCDEIRVGDRGAVSCQATVPEAVTAFLEGDDFLDVVRTAVWLGGDCDTLGAIAGSIAEGFYGVPEDLKERCRRWLPEDLRQVLDRFDAAVGK